MTSKRLSRRSVLRASALAAAGLSVAQRALADGEIDFIQPRPADFELWARITWAGFPVREEVGLNKKVTRWLHENEILPILEMIHNDGQNPNLHNDLWYRVSDGFLYTSGVQQIRPYRTPRILTEIPHVIADEPGFWAELIVPYAGPRREIGGLYATDEFFGETIQVAHYYGSVHRVIGIQEDVDGNIWYELFDDKPDNPSVWLPGRYLRYIPPEEFEPIHSEAKNKELHVSLTDQRIDCYEDGQLVFSTLTSSGSALPTPKGDHAVVYKQPSRHMYTDPEDPVSGGPSDEDFFDLPGVPFNTFFTTLGHAIHGTWWHGDYGRPRSHGCLNVTEQDARWIYRWVEPVLGYEIAAGGSSTEPGTPVIIT